MKQDEKWSLFSETGCVTSGSGPVELMQAAFRKVGVVMKCPINGEWFNDGNGWKQADKHIDTLWFVIPAQQEPCLNCQNVKPGRGEPVWSWKYREGSFESEIKKCSICGRPESEWTYAPDIEWAGIGSGLL